MHRLAKVLVFGALASALNISLYQSAYAAPSNTAKCPRTPFASTKSVKWKSGNAFFRISDELWGDKEKTRTIYDMANSWNQASQGNLVIRLGRQRGSSMRWGNGVSEIYYKTLTGRYVGLTKRSGGLAKLDTGKCYFDEVDIQIDPRISFTSQRELGDLSGPDNFDLIIAHEMGHALGLDHNNKQHSIMNETYPVGGPMGYFHQVAPYGIDRAKLRETYGNGNRVFDIAASRWKHGVADESVADVIKLTRTSGAPLTDNKITVGQKISFPFSIHNLGTETKSILIRFFMATDRRKANPVNTDKYLGESWHTLRGGTDLTAIQSIEIPDLDAGDYYFGYVVSTNELGESDSFNNFVTLYDKYTLSNPRQQTTPQASGIKIPGNSGWWQIQRRSDYKEVYQGPPAFVPLQPDTYNVINLTTGQRLTQSIVK